MKRFVLLLTSTALLASFGAKAADENTATAQRRVTNERRGEKIDIDGRVQALNRLNNKSTAKTAGLQAISKETAVPLPTLEEAQRQNPNAGLGDLFVAQEINTRTQKSMAELLKLHSDGKSWSEIAKDHNQDVTALEQKLERVEQAVGDADKQ
jgi:hypothetical protein